MKKRLLHNIGDFFIAFACIITAGFLAERQHEGYKYYFNLYLSESDPQLLTMAKWYTSRCWLIIGCFVSLMVLLMSVYSLILRANSRKHNVIFVIVSIFFAVIVFGVNQLLGLNASLQFLLGIVNRILIYSFILVFGFISYFDSKKQI